MRLILASASPRRKELLALLGLDFECIEPQCDESSTQPVKQRVVELSMRKACDVAKKQSLNSIVIGSDTLVAIDNQILGKPQNDAEAEQMLRLLSGKWHSVLSGVSVIDTKNNLSESFFEETRVHFIELSDDDIKWYVSTGEPADKAGAYALQGKAGAFIDRVEGDYNNVIGLPLTKLRQILHKYGFFRGTF